MSFKEQIEKQAIEEMAKVIAKADDSCRAQTIAKALVNADYRKQSEGENITANHPVDEFICSKCGLIMRDCCRYEIDEDDGDEYCFEFAFRFCPRCGEKMKGGAE